MRVKIFRISATIFGEIFREGSIFEITKSYPIGATFLGMNYNFERDEYLLKVEHESFPDMPEGYSIPFEELSIGIKRYDFYGKMKEVIDGKVC